MPSPARCNRALPGILLPPNFPKSAANEHHHIANFFDAQEVGGTEENGRAGDDRGR
jgi:hypothetical protein